MNELNSNISILVNPNVYLKDPETSELGKKIVQFSVDLMEELGYEDFTFKKLAQLIGSTEASIYRYFESKHQLLSYLTMWYWGWLEYRLMLAVINVPNPVEKLVRSIRVLTEKIEEDLTFNQLNEVKLNKIIISESSKIYLCKNVDEVNELGYFGSYKSLVERVSQIILEIDSTFQFPHMLISTIIEGAHHQRFFAIHLPRLTDVSLQEDAVPRFYTDLALKQLNIDIN